MTDYDLRLAFLAAVARVRELLAEFDAILKEGLGKGWE